MWADESVNAINLLKLYVYKKLNSSYGENITLYIHKSHDQTSKVKVIVFV